jgi:alkanesulfonate monooxygenase SsuD/methylene tetrahydromethanopterin reductase-like flavin-dependent oxidoreductase (luciferase family)
MPKNTYEVRVQRIEYQIAVVVVVADSEEEAEQLAYEEATDFTVENAEEMVLEIEETDPPEESDRHEN